MAKKKKKSEKWENIAAIAFVVVILLVIAGFWNNWWGVFEGNEESPNPIVRTSILNEPVKGNPDAPLTIVEYSDFECPFCGKWYREVYPLIDEAYIQTGRAKFVFKQFPLTRIHPNAMNAGIAAECAFEQSNDLFWKYHDILYENQDALDVESLKLYAGEVGLNQLQFDLCLTNEQTKKEVEEDFSTGAQSGITGTPGFIIGEGMYMIEGELIVGAHPFAKFQAAVERLS